MPGLIRVRRPPLLLPSRRIVPALLDGSESDGTNLYSFQTDFSAGWTPQSSTSFTNNATTAPNGSNVADKFIAPNSTGTARRCYSNVGGYNGAYTFSIYAKQAEFRYGGMYVETHGTGVGTQLYFDLQTGSINAYASGGNETLISATAEAAVNGFWKFTLKGNSAASGGSSYQFVSFEPSLQTGFNSGFGASVTGNGSDGFYVWRPKTTQP